MTTKKKIDKGIIMFAHNNDEINYLKLAVVNSVLIQKHLGLEKKNIAVVTDEASYDHVVYKHSKNFIKKNIGHLIFSEKDVKFKHQNVRTYKDTSIHSRYLSFYNKNRCDAYDLSPFDETILLDADYLILSDRLNGCWGHNNELMMNWQYKDVLHDRVFPELERLHSSGIPMYWATVVYFRKSGYCKEFFDTVKQVRDNKQYYDDIYRTKGRLYRNDFSFSIAAHIVGGFRDRQIPQLPVKLYKSFDTDDVVGVSEDLGLYMCLEKNYTPGDFIATKWKGVDIHIMNKWALGRISDGILNNV